jgi:hypothetical protein
MNVIREQVRKTQPHLKFYPVVYYDLMKRSFVNKYSPYFDALIMPFRDDPYHNTFMTDTLRPQLNGASAVLAAKDRKLILMVYAYPLSSLDGKQRTTVPPDVHYVHQITSVGIQYGSAGTIAGVIQYALPLTTGQPQKSEVPAHTGHSMAVATVDSGIETSTGNWAGARTRIVLDASSRSCVMKLWHSDNRSVRSLTGHHFKQVLVAGHIVWNRDVASDGTGWYETRPLNLTRRLTTGKAQLVLRLYERAAVANYRIRARFDDLTLAGCHTIGDPGFEAAGRAWTYIRRGGPVLAGRHTADHTYSTNVFKAVASLYAQGP